ncbi:EAL domain-containing protein [Azospirillum halopraeferens]|uniref:EAL domain-containing protein n=1 Tax=Azospirillum halopraeferens TaxID=34010 RepID=UPI0004132429|nr:EAL domain-containing protein [Azospirillum halopraeferens]
MIRTLLVRTLGALLILVALTAPGRTEDADTETAVRIGVLAYRGIDAALAQWLPHAAYFSQRIPGTRFTIVPLGYDELSAAVRERSVQFVITNTGHYAALELGGHATRIATRLMDTPGGLIDRMGGVVITRARRTDLNTYADLRNTMILYPDRMSLGGWQAHEGEARAQGVDLPREAILLPETRNHETVVYGVLADRADAGFVRADLVEQMAREGKIRLEDLRVVNPRDEPGFPFRLSTRLYPEWPLAKVSGTPEALAREVLIAALRLPSDSEAARAAGIHGWVVPGSYKVVDELFRDLRVGPYATISFALTDVLSRYAPWIAGGGGAVILLLVGAILRIAQSRRRLRNEIGRRAEAERSLRILNSAVEQSPSSLVITDADRGILYVNDTFCRVTGYRREEVIGANVGMLASGQTPASVYREMWSRIGTGQVWTGDLCNRRKDGSLFWERVTISPVFDDTGAVINYLAAKQDITLQRSYEQALERAANYDALTGLPNRTLAHDRLQRHVLDGDPVAVLHVGTDNFVRINESLGQRAGDAVIRELARRFGNLVDEADTLARVTGDEFLVVHPRGGEADTLAAALLAAAAEPIAVDKAVVRVTVRIGIAVAPHDGGSAIDLEKAAYSAANRAREAGGNTVRRFLRSMDTEVRRRFELEAGLRRALDEGGLELHLQPYVESATGRFTGAEALVRWRRGDEGYVPPGVFIPIAEDAGLVRDIDRWVVDAAAAAAARLRRELGRPFPIAVNVSPKDLIDLTMVDHIARALDLHRLPPDALEVEVTEGVFLSGEQKAGKALRILHGMGVPIAIDDFGTGYSSLAYLRKYPFNKLKIDRSFVSGMDSDATLNGLVNAVTSMALHLGLSVTAEGVEREEEAVLLRRAGCTCMQGYLFARPMPSDSLLTLLKEAAVPVVTR